MKVVHFFLQQNLASEGAASRKLGVKLDSQPLAMVKVNCVDIKRPL
jgi:hypothetical protein